MKVIYLLEENYRLKERYLRNAIELKRHSRKSITRRELTKIGSKTTALFRRLRVESSSSKPLSSLFRAEHRTPNAGY